MKRFLFGLSLALICASTSYAQGPLTASGEVVSVRMFLRTMRVRDASGSNEIIRYDVPGSATVTFAGQPGRLGHLRNGDRVNIEYVDRGDGREAAVVRVPTPTPEMDQRVREGEMSTITGVVQGIDYRNRTMRVLGDQSGETFAYAIPESTRITVTGREAGIGRVRQGDEVVMRFRSTDGQERVAARVGVPETTTPLERREDRAAPAGVAGQQPRTQLPRTAGSLPLLGLIALLGFAGAALVRVGRRVAKRS